MEQKIIHLVKQGWRVEILSDSQGWFQVAFTHSIWGEVEGYSETLPQAIGRAYKEARLLTVNT